MHFRFGRRRLAPVAAALLSCVLVIAAHRSASACPAPLPAMTARMALPTTRAHVTRIDGARAAGTEIVRILAIGSSSTEGVGASSPALTYPNRLQGELGSAWGDLPVAVINAGIGGETADQTLLRLEAALRQPDKPDLVVWQVGTNDAIAGGDEDAFRHRLARGIALVRAAGIDLILLDQQFYPTIPDLARFVHAVASVADQEAVPVFSRFALMQAWSRQDPALLTGMLSRDGFHMGDQGYGCLAEALGRSIVQAVPRPAQAVARAKRQPADPSAPSLRRG